MSASESNALAGLAKRLRNGLYINPNDERFDGPVIVSTLDANDVLAAQRIVAELAKVDTVLDGNGKQKTACFEGCDAVDRCRAIAEEGDCDGKK